MFSIFSLHFKYRQNAPFTVHVFIFTLQFQIVSNTVRMHHLPFLFTFFFCISKTFQIPSECTIYHHFSFYSQKLQIFLNTVTMHALETLFSSISLQFQIVSKTMRVHALETLFYFFSLQFQILSECMKVQRPICNKYILNTERKVFNFLWLNFVESLHYFK